MLHSAIEVNPWATRFYPAPSTGPAPPQRADAEAQRAGWEDAVPAMCGSHPITAMALEEIIAMHPR